MCEQFHFKNDFKLNLLHNFYQDHIVKHIIDYENCYSSTQFKQANSLQQKDELFVACHKEWISKMQNEVTSELEAKVKDIF